MQILQYSVFPPSIGTLRVSLHEGTVRTHIKTAEGWDPQMHTPATEEHLCSALMGVTGKFITATFGGHWRLELELTIHHEHRKKWYHVNDVGEWLELPQEQVALEVRCQLLAQCVADLQDKGFIHK